MIIIDMMKRQHILIINGKYYCGKVALFDSVTSYTQIYRACNYGILFYRYEFGCSFLYLKLLAKGCTLCTIWSWDSHLVIFYLLLLSLSEHIGFEWSI